MAIDLGNNFCKLAVVLPGKDKRIFGNAAVPSAKRDPITAFADLPSIVGKKLDHPAVKKYQERYPYHSLSYNNSNGLLTFSVDGQNFTAEELLGMFFEYLKDTAEKYSGAPMNTAVITVPSHFTQSDRLAILRVAELAGIEVLQLMNSNAAVGLNYGVFRRNSFDSNPQNFLFFDVGFLGTTATVVSYKVTKSREGDILEENPHMFILGVGSDPFLGTSDFIGRLLNHFVEKFKASNPDLKGDVRKNPRAMAKLSVEAQRIFKILSANPEIYASVENVMEGRDFNLRVQRSELEAMCTDLVERIRKPISTAIEVAAVPFDSIQSVILFGGGTRVPMIQAALKELTGKSELGKSINSDEAAAIGAVYQAAYHTPGFKVKRFVTKDTNRLPVLVTFPRIPKDGETEGETGDPFITRTLFQTANPCPQKRSITFNRLAKDMSFTVYYGEIPSALGRYLLGPEPSYFSLDSSQ
ncbi:Hypoxia up-regulated protein 1 [Sparganum proliferum]